MTQLKKLSSHKQVKETRQKVASSLTSLWSKLLSNLWSRRFTWLMRFIFKMKSQKKINSVFWLTSVVPTLRRICMWVTCVVQSRVIVFVESLSFWVTTYCVSITLETGELSSECSLQNLTTITLTSSTSSQTFQTCRPFTKILRSDLIQKKTQKTRLC